MTETQRTQGEWQEWSKISDFIRHTGETVEVMRRDSGTVLIRGRATNFTDLLKGGGILEHGNYGLDRSGQSVVRALPIPSLLLPSLDEKDVKKVRERYREWSRQYLFRVVDPAAGKS